MINYYCIRFVRFKNYDIPVVYIYEQLLKYLGAFEAFVDYYRVLVIILCKN